MKLAELSKTQLIKAAETLGLTVKNVSNTTAASLAKIVESQARRDNADLDVLVDYIVNGTDMPTPVAKEEAPKVATSRPRTGVGKTATEFLTQHSDWNDQQILEKVNERHPENETSKGCISWYRAKLVREGVIVKK